ncbi:MAG: type II secretion system protein [Gammaproteobacteria bacterium]
MTRQTGFSLVELAMVLFIISLLLGGLLVPLASQLEARQRNETQEQLDRIKEALIGFAIINGRLPCYTTQADPANANYGIEDVVCNPTGLTTDGILPWKTLGLDKASDPWGVQRTASTDPWSGYWRYRVDAAFLPFPPSNFTLATTVSSHLSVVELNPTASTPGSPVKDDLISSTERAVAVVYTTGANGTADGENATYEATPTQAIPAEYEGGAGSNLDRDGDGNEDEFDDITVWLTRPLLFTRMVAAGTLP